MHWLVLPKGALVNAATVLVGSTLGLLLHRGLPEPLKRASLLATGLVTLLIGMQMALKVEELVSVVLCMLAGAILGELWQLEQRLERFGEALRARFAKAGGHERFSEGLLTALLIFCVGSMTIVGSLQEGMTGDASVIYAKSVLDGFTSVALASTYGIGVLVSAGPLLLLQGLLTWLGAALGQAVSAFVVAQLSAVGGVILLGLGIRVLELRRIAVANLLPALVLIVPAALLIEHFRH
jgi:uncharacterized protein